MCGSDSSYCICNCSCKKGVMCFMHTMKQQFFERLHHGVLDELCQKKNELARRVQKNIELQNKIENDETQEKVYNGYLDFYKNQLVQVESVALPCLEITNSKSHLFLWFDIEKAKFDQIFTRPIDEIRKIIKIWEANMTSLSLDLVYNKILKAENESAIKTIEQDIHTLQHRIDEFEVELKELSNLQNKVEEIAQDRGDELYFKNTESRCEYTESRGSRVKEIKKAQHKDKVIHIQKQNELKMRNKPKFFEKSRKTSEQCQFKRRDRSRSIQRKQNNNETKQ